jgi:hypothetical protein
MFVHSVQKHVAEQPLIVLFDPGSKSGFINKRAFQLVLHLNPLTMQVQVKLLPELS